ncbi:uncharacterized protein LOC121410220 isoform X2 [Lytechinus variegatus]|uniref:uncharacterized protein LOC121410220 isoform X2 n=1 Tax=Lytechinus variegatus TaxID=7654 RepID=UPI001BB1F3D4|nr:uncharacterized protein LOC121410220 isoform X2 [Lytechinus variegatus]
MNWMGGVRNRLKVKNDRKRQQDFFEKQKFTSRVQKHKTSIKPAKKKQSMSLDLVSLQAANFSAAQFNKNGTGIRSSDRVNRVDLGKSQGLPRQKFVVLPDASPDSKPSILNLSKPSPQESTRCQKRYSKYKRHSLSTITEDKSSVTDLNSQDISDMLSGQMERSDIWTSTPIDFWHKKKMPKRHNVTLGSQHPMRQGDHHDIVKREHPFHSPSTSEKLLLNSSKDQMKMMDDSDYLEGKTPGSNRSDWSDFSTLMEDTDEATVPSIDSDDLDYQVLGSNQVPSQSFPESLQSNDVPTQQWTLQATEEESMSDVPDSTFNYFKDYHYIDNHMGRFTTGHPTQIFHQPTTDGHYTSSDKKEDYKVQKHTYSKHITTDIHPANEMSAHNEVPTRNTDQPGLRDQPDAPEVTMVKKTEQLKNKHQRRSRRIQFKGHVKQRSSLDQSHGVKEQRDLACNECSSFTSPEDSGTYLMTKQARLDRYRHHSGLQDFKASQVHHLQSDASLQFPNRLGAKAEISVSGHAITRESNRSSSNANREQSIERYVIKKFARGKALVHPDKKIDIMNLYTRESKHVVPVDEEKGRDMQVHPYSKHHLMPYIRDSQSMSLEDNQLSHENTAPVIVDSNDGIISDVNEEETGCSSSIASSSSDESADMDLGTDSHASSINNWQEFMHNVHGVNNTEAAQNDSRFVKDVPCTAQQMLQEVIDLDRQLQKEAMESKTDDMESTLAFVGGEERRLEKLSDTSSSKLYTEVSVKDRIEGIKDNTSPVSKLKTLLASNTKNSDLKDTLGKGHSHKDQNTNIKGKPNAEVLVKNSVSSSRKEQPVAQLLQENTSLCGTESLKNILTSQTDTISTTVVSTNEDPVKMGSVVSTSTSTTFQPKGEVVMCDRFVQCSLIGDPLSMSRGKINDVESSMHSSDIDVTCIDTMKQISACDSDADTVLSHENDFESCASTPQ